MISRRDCLKLMLATGAAAAIRPGRLAAADKKLSLITRAIPSSGERLPAVGLGNTLGSNGIIRRKSPARVYRPCGGDQTQSNR